MKYLPVVLIVLSGVTYHALQKLMQRDQSPWVVLSAVYFVAFLATLIPAIVTRPSINLGALAPTILLGLACVGIELGVLLAYRAGWKMSLLSTNTSVSGLILLAMIGVLFFGEKLEPRMLLGLALALAGLILGQPLGH